MSSSSTASGFFRSKGPSTGSELRLTVLLLQKSGLAVREGWCWIGSSSENVTVTGLLVRFGVAVFRTGEGDFGRGDFGRADFLFVSAAG